MAVNILAQVRWPQVTMLPRDVVMINPCFRNNLAGPGWDSQGLAQDLANLIASWQVPSQDPVEVRFYDLEGSVPVYPMAIATANAGNTPDVGDEPQEIAVCLSFFADRNVPRRRGRLYIPHYKIENKTALDHHINAGTMNKVGTLAPQLAGLGGADIDWIVWSRAAGAGYKVTDWFVDNAWDTVKSRGYRADQRVVGTVSG
jgi:hypothetical protein